jgi:hypothetical protein
MEEITALYRRVAAIRSSRQSRRTELVGSIVRVGGRPSSVVIIIRRVRDGNTPELTTAMLAAYLKSRTKAYLTPQRSGGWRGAGSLVSRAM